MKIKKNFSPSFRTRIIILYTVVFSLTLIIFGFYLYKDFGRRLNQNVDDLLLTRADSVVDSIENFFEREKINAAGKGLKPEELDKLETAELATAAQNWVNRRLKDPLLLNIVVTIFDREGREVASSGPQSASFPLKPAILQAVLKGESLLTDLQLEVTQGRKTPFRALTFPVMVDNRVNYLVRVMTPVSFLHSTLNELRLLLFLIFPLGILLSGLSAWFLSRVTLKPITHIVETARQINAENLKTRLTLPPAQDEINLLAKTFNEMLDRLDRTFTSQREFIENFSHEIKTPLAIIKGELEVTLKKARPAREYRSTLNSSLEEVNRIIKIVDDLLVMARLEAEGLQGKTSLFNLSQLAGEVAEEMRILARQKEQVILLEETAQPEIFGDREKIKRVLMNLLDNAIKFTPAGGQITVRVGIDRQQAVIKVMDNGPGLTAEEAAYIFDRFYRADGSHASPGSGLGLSIARSIVEAHHGKIEVSSHPGEGSIFTVYLPLSDSK